MKKKPTQKPHAAMTKVQSIWKAKKAEGWTMERLGIAMGYPEKTARQSVSQFLKSQTPQVSTLQKFADALGKNLETFVPSGVKQMSSSSPAAPPRVLPYDPIEAAMKTHEHARRTIVGILESYNSNFDALAEPIQNSMDALEDAFLSDLPGPFLLEITIDLQTNSISVLDTGIGMSQDQICESFAPSATFKDPLFATSIVKKRGDKHPYRGYKGVGLTFLAYGTNDIQIQSKQSNKIVKGRMRNGRLWAEGQVDQSPTLALDNEASPLDTQKRGTWIRLHFSPATKPANLSNLGSSLQMWEAIIRTRTAAGQVLINRPPLVANLKVKLNVIPKDGLEQSKAISPEFYFPSLVKRNPDFKFLDVWEYHKEHPGIADHSPGVIRQDGIFLRWTTDDIRRQIGVDKASEFVTELAALTPELYAFRPYHAPVWGDLNRAATDQVRTHFFAPGLVVAVDRQRMADVFAIKASRSELLAQNIFVVVHFNKAKPDQGRKTLQSQTMELAQQAADAATQYLLKQNGLLKPAGEKTTAAQREVELNHEDWVDNVKAHAKAYPLVAPPITYASIPITEQDVVGLFNQLSALQVFPGIKVLATSAAHTYDCYIQFERKSRIEELRYSDDHNPLGLSTDVLGNDEKHFVTRGLTLEFKNNLEGLIADIEHPQKRKTFSKIDICVCWGTVDAQHRSYELAPVIEANMHERRYPGITHLLRKDGESHVMQVVLLEEVIKLVNAGRIRLIPRQPQIL